MSQPRLRCFQILIALFLLLIGNLRELRTQVVINEVLASNARTNVDEDGDSSDWVELKNLGDVPVDLDGYSLSDDTGDARKWTFPSVTIPPGEFLLVWCSGKNRTTGIVPEFPQLVAHWPLDEGQGANFENAIDDAFDGYLTAGASVGWERVEEDVAGNRPTQEFATRFTGTGSFIQTDFPGIGGNNPRTIACWIKTSRAGANDILGYGRPTDGLKWHFRVNSVAGNGLVGGIRTEYQGGQNVGTTRVDDGRWHHVAAVFAKGSTRGQEIDHYVDGVLQGKTGGDRSITTDILDPLYRLTIGLTRQSTTSLRFFDGLIADVRVYDQGLSSEGVSAVMQGDEPPPIVVPLTLHTNFELNSDGETLLLLNADGDLADVILFPEQHSDISYARAPDGVGAFLYHVTPTPLATNSGPASETPLIVSDTKFEPNRGFYDEPFTVEITTATEGASIRYTLDSSEPTPTHGTLYSGPISVTDTTNIRAIAYKADSRSSDVDTHTYIFLETPAGGGVIHQPTVPDGFPSTWGPNGGPRDYEMDPRIAADEDSPLYDPRVKEALLAMPSMSLVMDVDDLFDPASGIYTNPLRRGSDWERACSIEFIYPEDDAAGHQANAGIRIQGNASRNPDRPKHNMRLLFKRQYGEGKLRHSLFEDTSVDEFDVLILRGGNGDAWFHPIANQQRQTQYIRDQWHRDIQLGMGRLSAHQRYMHLYINGLYWGLYHVFERPTGSFLASHLGGEKEDWDAINSLDPLDGDLQAWNEMMAIADAGVGTSQAYAAIQEYLDVPNLIDFLLINFYSGNFDWDTKNWYAGRRREPGAGYMFFNWDAERTFYNINENRVTLNLSNRPTHMHQQLTANPEYRLLFADHVHRHFFNDGLLTPAKAVEFWMARADEIRVPLVAESARFGDSKRSIPYRVDAEWNTELRRITTDYMPRRTGIVLGQLRSRGLYPNVEAPSFDRLGGHIETDFDLTITAPTGDIYYTLDGTDPRLAGGDVAPGSTRASLNAEIVIDDTTQVRARVLNAGTWSAMTEATFVRSALRVTEIMYHPPAEAGESPFDAEDFEFIELRNTGSTPIELEGVRIVGDIEFDFGLGAITTVAPGEFVVAVKNLEAFESRYDPQGVAGEYRGRLSNGGGSLSLLGAIDETIQEFVFNNRWHPSTDGEGYSLVIIDDFALPDSWSEAASWRPSDLAFGSPGTDESTAGGRQLPGDANQDGVADISDPIKLLLLLFRGDTDTPCEGTMSSSANVALLDANGDASVNLSDAVHLLSYLISQGPPPHLGSRCVRIEGCGDACTR